MRLDDLAASQPFSLPPRVPDWSFGAFHRRCITYATGVEDVGTRVIWVQSHGLTGDLRIPAWRPDVSARSGLEDCTVEELALLASAEGGIAVTGLDGEMMTWTGWAAFQPYDKWAEPGILQRIGACLVEVAPSGVYVEDWRLQPWRGDLHVGLRLVSETVAGVTAARDGGIVIAGEHAIFVLDRRTPLPTETPVQDQIRSAADPRAVAAIAFDFQAGYARRGADGAYVAELALNPFDEGKAVPILEGFEPAEPGHLLQQVGEVLRLWKIDTLALRPGADLTSPATPESLAWLQRESGTLLKGL